MVEVEEYVSNSVFLQILYSAFGAELADVIPVVKTSKDGTRIMGWTLC